MYCFPPASFQCCHQADEADARYDSQYLLLNSAFALVLPSESFNSAVCSGSVPVVLSKASVAPLEGFVDFGTYGLSISQQGLTLQDLIEKLEEEFADEAKMHVLRENARAFCTRALQTYEVQASAALEAFQLPRRAVDTASPPFQQTLYFKGRLFAVWEGMLWQTVSTKSHSLSRDWRVKNRGPYLWILTHGSSVFAVHPDYKVYRFQGSGLRRVRRYAQWELAAAGDVTILAICDEIMFGYGLDQNVYHQQLSSMSPNSYWKLLVLARPVVMTGLASLRGRLYGASEGRIYTLNLTGPYGPHWSHSTRSHLPGDFRHLL